MVTEHIDELVEKVLADKNVSRLLALLAQHNLDTYQHSKRVAWYSVLLGRKSNFAHDALTALATGALLHDIGKVFISNDILNKQSALSDAEKESLQQHVTHAAKMLNGEASHLVHDIIMYHHGYQSDPYPIDLSTDVRLLNGSTELVQIVALADQFDALSMPRAYKPAFDCNDVFGILNKHFTGNKKYIKELQNILYI